MNPASAQGGFSRRQFLGGGVLGLVALGAGGWLAARITDGRSVALLPLKQLGSGEQQMLVRIADAVLDGVLPEPAGERAEWMPRLLQNIDGAMTHLPLELQGDTRKLLSMLAFAPTRLLVTGQWGGWHSATREQIAGRLDALAASSNATQRIVYRVLRDLCMSAFYGDRRSWPLIGYPGPVVNRIANG